MNIIKTLCSTTLLVFALTGCNNSVLNSTGTPDVVRTEHDKLISEQIALQVTTDTWKNDEAASLITKFYTNTEHMPAWSSDAKLTDDALKLIDLINEAEAFGLQSEFYGSERVLELEESIANATNDEDRYPLLTQLDILLTDAYFHFGTDIRFGILDQETFERVWKKDQLDVDLVATLQNGINNKTVIASLLELQPDNNFYHDLQMALAKFVRTHNLEMEPVEVVNFREDSALSYQQATAALLASNYITDSIAANDSLLIESIKMFQAQHGLNADGLIGKNTAIALSMSNRERFENAAVTLERWRWNKAPEGDHLFVNIPGFHVMAVEDGNVALRLKVIVGTVLNQTPELTEEMEYMEVYPFWNVPYSIATKEMLPKIQADSTYLTERTFKVFDKQGNEVNPGNIDWENLNASNFDYKFRKDGGYANDLGLIKFMFPNTDNVYMHDTPGKGLFANDMRAYSHGCIRVQDPFLLAEYLLTRDEHIMNRDSLDNFVGRKVRKVVTLQENVPVYVAYYTCEADKDYNIYFFNDVYGRNTPYLEGMFGKADTEGGVVL